MSFFLYFCRGAFFLMHFSLVKFCPLLRSLILSSYVRYIWKSSKLYDLFSSSLDVLDEMRPIRLIEHTNRAKLITPKWISAKHSVSIYLKAAHRPTHRDKSLAASGDDRPKRQSRPILISSNITLYRIILYLLILTKLSWVSSGKKCKTHVDIA